MNDLINVPFRNTTLEMIGHDGQPYVAMRPIVEGMGLDWKTQHRKLMADKDRWSVVIMTTETPAGLRESVCIPLRKTFAWLNTVSANKVRPELRETILDYQRRCDDVLWEHWTGEAEGERNQSRNYYFSKYPHWPAIRARVLAGERYRDIATAIARSVGAVRYAIQRMIQIGLLAPAKVAAAQVGASRRAALRQVSGWGQLSLALEN